MKERVERERENANKPAKTAAELGYSIIPSCRKEKGKVMKERVERERENAKKPTKTSDN
jgi:hypothetical protein